MTTHSRDVVESDTVPESERRAVERAQRAMKRFGFEITTIQREPGSLRYWQVRWRVNNPDLVTPEFGVSGETPSAAVRAALVNAFSTLHL
jgi:hypothetical protein